MSKFVFSSVAAGLIGGALMLSGSAPASALTLPSPAVSAPAEAGMVEQVHRRDRRARRYDRRRHGPRYSHRRPGFRHHYGGYWYSSPWWTGPSIGFGITIPGATFGLGGGSSGHVQWCLNRYRSYDPASDTFLGYDGYRHRCNSPYR